MSRDSLKTLAGLVVILLVIGGAFWYGSTQRQAQVTPSMATPTPAVHHTTATPAATPKPATSPAPLAGPLPAETPRTGAADDLLPLAALSVAWVLYRRSRLVPGRQN